MHRLLLIEHVGAVTGGTGQDHWSGGSAVGGGAEPIANRLIQGFDQSGKDSGVEVDPSNAAAVDDTVEKVIRRADEAMYATKQAGRNQVALYSPPAA